MIRKSRFLCLLLAVLLSLPAFVGIAMAEDTPTLTMFIDETWWPYDKWQGTIPETVAANAGVIIDAMPAADENQLALMIASGEMPDLVVTSKFDRMSNSNVSYSLDELIETYPNVPFKPHSVLRLLNTAQDGNFYSVFCGVSPDSVWKEKGEKMLTEGAGLLLNQTVLDALGNPAINSMEDLDNVFQMVHEQYPDMQVVLLNPIHNFNWLLIQYGINYLTDFSDVDGELMYMARQPAMVDFYKKVNEWYHKGYFDASVFALKTEEESNSIMVRGNAFAYFAYDGMADTVNAIIRDNGDADKLNISLLAKPMLEQSKFYSVSAGHRGMYISKSCKNPEAAFRFLSYVLSDEGQQLMMWGIEGEDWVYGEDGNPVMMYSTDDEDAMRDRGLKYWGWTCADAYHMEAGAQNQTLLGRKMLSTISERNPVLGMIRFNADSDEAIIISKLKDMVKNQEMLVYMAESEEACEQAYYSMMDLAKQIGVESLEAAAASQYEGLKEAYEQIKDNVE